MTLRIVWEEGHVIEEDQCVNTAVLMQGGLHGLARANPKQSSAECGVVCATRDRARKRSLYPMSTCRFVGFGTNTQEQISIEFHLKERVSYLMQVNAGSTERSCVGPSLYVIRWARRKFKRLRLKTKGARDWFDRLGCTNPTLFAHWQLCHGNGRASGAVSIERFTHGSGNARG